MAWTFNNAGTNSLTKLEPTNGGMSALMTANGVTLRSAVSTIAPKRVEMTPAGVSWTAQRTTGYSERQITWTWGMSVKDETDYYKVINAIDAYLKDGREYILTDGTRTTNFAVLSEAYPITARPSTPDGRIVQTWFLRYRVLRPLVTTGKF